MRRSRWFLAGSWALFALGCSRSEGVPHAAIAPSGRASNLASSSSLAADADDAAAAPEAARDEAQAPAEEKRESRPNASTPGAPPPPAVAQGPARPRAVAHGGARPAKPVAAKAALAPGDAPRSDAKPDVLSRARDAEFNTESYSRIVDNEFVSPRTAPLSTFSIDVDTAAYANVRRFVDQGSLPPPDAVRIEELVNYFTYAYPDPSGDTPFSVTTELSKAPWNPSHRLLLVGLQGKRLPAAALPPRNLVFLVDVSGSMNEPNKLPLLKYALRELVNTLSAKDHVSLVVYAGAGGVVLNPTPASDKTRILEALDRMEAGGSTNGAEGIEAAYALAERSFDPKGVNRVVLATDGDFNVGVTSEGDLVRLIEAKRAKGVSLSVLGFGMGNLKDATLEKLADHGNGNYAYIDSRAEARKVLVEQGGSTLVTIAKDVKIQVEWNPAEVGAYRLIGYENRALAAQDFNDDKKDAGDIGAGHSVTALYEIVPPGAAEARPGVDPLKYQPPSANPPDSARGELSTIKLRFKRPRTDVSELLRFAVKSDPRPLEQTSNDFRFASAVASFGMLLRNSEARGSSNFGLVQTLAEGARGADPAGYRAGFIGLIAKTRGLAGSSALTQARP